MTLDERLLAYVDGELAGEELARFEAEMAADPRLKDEVDKHRGLSARLAVARAERAEMAGRSGAKVAKGKAAPIQARLQLSPWHWTAIVVGLSLGIASGLAAGHYAWPEGGPLAVSGGIVTAQGPLETALTDQLAMEKGAIAIGGSFRTAKGRYCRTFRDAPDRLAGLACRQGGGWVLQTTTVLGPPNVMPRAVLSAVDGLIAGAPLDAAAERAARTRGWK